MKRKSLLGLAVVAVLVATASVAMAAPGTETGPSSSQSPYLVPTKAGVVTKSLLTVGDSVTTKPDGTPYRMVGIPDGLGAFDNGDGTFTVLMNHELGSSQGVVRAHGARGAFVSRWTVRTSDLTVLKGEDQIQSLHTWDPALNAGAGDWQVTSGDAAPARLNRLCSADLAPVSAFFNAASGRGYHGRLFMDGEEGGTGGRPFGHVVASGDSYELTPWLGNLSFENVVAHPNTRSDATVAMGLDDGDATVGQQVYLYRGIKTGAGNPVQRAGLTNGKLYGVKVGGVPQSEYQKTDWQVGDQVPFELADVSQYAGVGGTSADGIVNTLEEDSQAKGVTNFQRPEDGAWDPSNPSDFYFVTTSSFGPLPGENRTGQTRLWRLRFEDPTDPSSGGTLTLLVNGPVGTADSPPATGTQSTSAAGPQMLDNLTVNRGRVVALEDVGSQAYLGGVWVYDIAGGGLVEIAQHDPTRFTPGAPGFLTKDEESSGVIPAPFLGTGWYLLDVQAHYTISGELVQGGQLLAMHVPAGKPLT
jgi:Alkaline phosphatase PhoX